MKKNKLGVSGSGSTADVLWALRWKGSNLRFRFADTRDHIAATMISSNLIYEADLANFIFGHLFPPHGMIDVGANIGTHAIATAATLGAPVLALEPYRSSFEQLKSNIALNNMAHLVTPLNIAAGSDRSISNIAVRDKDNAGTASLGSSGERVEVHKIDDLDFGFIPGLIKIDVEGEELNVIRGSVNTIMKYTPIVVAEAATCEQFSALVSYFKRINYRPVLRLCVTPTYVFRSTRALSD